MAKKTAKGSKAKIDVTGNIKSRILKTIKSEISGGAKKPGGGGSIHAKGPFLRGHGKTANPFVKSTEPK